ncbi:MAG: hypothetical protein E4H14_20315 [Candidatus Thorarchaeota archaeon]|nr:MAG: hypothetical protein E4H14_20315 [Candidatus Thorarchaeota archaeon]
MKKQEIEMGINLSFLASMYGLEERGIKVQVRDRNSMEKSREFTLGIYKPFRNKILFLEELKPYWFILLTTIVHEYRHYQQRKQMFVSLGTLLVLCIISLAFESSIYWYIILVICSVLMILAQKYFEWDAKRCVTRYLDVEILFQDALEKLLLVQGLENSNKATRYYFKKIHRLIKTAYPSLTI